MALDRGWNQNDNWVADSRIQLAALVLFYILLYLWSFGWSAGLIGVLILIPIAHCALHFGFPAGLAALAMAGPVDLLLFSLVAEQPWTVYFSPARLPVLILGGLLVVMAARYRDSLVVLAEQRAIVRSAERSIKRANATNRALARLSSGLVLGVGSDGVISLYHPPKEWNLDLPVRANGMQLGELLPPTPARRAMKALQKSLKSGKPQRFSYQLCSKTGEIEDFDAVCVRNGDDEALLAVTRQASDSDSEAMFSQVADNIDEVFWVSNLDRSQFHYINPAVERIWGYSVEEFLSTPSLWIDSIHPHDKKAALAAFGRLGTQSFEEQYRIVDKSGGVRWIRDRAFSVNGAESSGRIAGLTADITREKRTELALAQSEQRNRHLVDYAADALYVIDSMGQIVDANRCACDMLGYTRQELLKLSIHDLSPQFFPNNLKQGLEPLNEGEGLTIEGTHTRKDRTTLSVEMRVGQFERGGEVMILALARDTTQKSHNTIEQRALLGVAQTILAAETLAELTEQLPGRLAVLLDFPSVTIELLHPESQELEVIGSCGPPRPPARVKVHQSLSGRVIQTRTTRVEGGVGDRSDTGMELLQKQYLETVICVPLIVGPRVIGALSLGHPEACEVQHSMVATIEVIATGLSHAVEHHRSQQRLRLSRHVIERTLDPVCWLTREGTFYEANPAFCRLSGYAWEALQTVSLFSVFPSLSRKSWEQRWVTPGNPPSNDRIHTLTGSDGSSQSVTLDFDHLLLDRGEVVCAFVRPKSGDSPPA